VVSTAEELRMSEFLDQNKKLMEWWFVGKRKVKRRRSREVKKNNQEEKKALDRMEFGSV
jgi:hypothetical protein